MAKFKLQGGVEIDLLNREELRAELQDWLAEIKRGVRFRRAALYGDSDGAGALILGAGPGPEIGPAGSMVWAVTRVSVTGLASNEAVSLFVNDPSPTAFVTTIPDTAPAALFGSTGLMLNPLDKLLVVGSGLTASARYVINVQAVELPVQLAWQLIG